MSSGGEEVSEVWIDETQKHLIQIWDGLLNRRKK